MTTEVHAALITHLQRALDAEAAPQTKAWWENYVKDSAPFRGVKMPLIRRAVHHWYRTRVAGAVDHPLELALALLRQTHSEDKLAAALLIQEILLPARHLEPERDLPRCAALFAEGTIYDWNMCDWFCIKVLGPLIAQQGRPCAEAIAAWHRAANLWQARASLVAFVPVIDEPTYDELMLPTCAVLIGRPERFAKTAVGWVLRELAHRDRPTVEAFIKAHIADFTAEVLNNATKYFPAAAKKRLRQLRRRG